MDKELKDSIKSTISRNVIDFMKSKEIQNELASRSLNDGDMLLINNSFVLRSPLVKTTKNPQHLLLEIKNARPDTSRIFVSTPTSFNQDYKVFDSRQAASLPRISIDEAIDSEVQKIGRLIFFLIGGIEEKIESVMVNNKDIKVLKFDPVAKKPDVIQVAGKRTIVVNQVTDPEAIWYSIKPELAKIPEVNLDALEAAYGVAFETIQKEARLSLTIPQPSSPRLTNSFIQLLEDSLNSQRNQYSSALEKYRAGEDPEGIHLRDIMRISYNFADDAIKLLQLLVSLSDLKAIIFWMTLKAHFDLAESIRNLPWTKSDKKADHRSYVDKIKGARNHAFHNLLHFDRTIEADLLGVKVNAKKLTILPSYAQRQNVVPLDYEDREIVDVLKDITRSTETILPSDFWIKNLTVLEAFENLLIATKDALWLLNSAVQDQ